jgi:PAS domain S-box-containing protein
LLAGATLLHVAALQFAGRLIGGDAAAAASILIGSLLALLLGFAVVRRIALSDGVMRSVRFTLPLIVTTALATTSVQVWRELEIQRIASDAASLELRLEAVEAEVRGGMGGEILALHRFAHRLRAVSKGDREHLFDVDAAQMQAEQPASQGIGLVRDDLTIERFVGPSTVSMQGRRVDTTPDRAAAYARAKASQRPVALGPLHLVGAPAGTPLGMLVIVPMRGDGDSTEYLVRSLRMEMWLEAIRNRHAAGIPVEISVGAAALPNAGGATSGDANIVQRHFVADGLEFTLRTDRSALGGSSVAYARVSRLVLGGALLLSLLVGLMLRFAMVARREGVRATAALAQSRNLAQEREQLQQRQAQVGRLIEQSAAVLWRWEPGRDWPVSFVSENVSQWGYDANQFIEREIPYRGIVHPDDASALEQLVQHANAEGHDRFDATYRIRTAQGNWVWVDERTVIERDPTGKPVGWHGLTLDVSERRAMIEDRERLLAQLQVRNDDLSHFAFVASHDLQEPLRKSRMFLDLLRSEVAALDDRSRDRLARADAALERMQEIVAAIGGYVRLGDSPPRGNVDLDAVLADVLADLDERIESAGASIETSDLGTVPGSRAELYQVLLNLISNSLKFRSPERALRIVIGPVACDPDAEDPAAMPRLKFVVEDNGIGFDPTQREAIFRPFKRLNTLDQFPGAGMGLAIVKRIVERHGGRIEAEAAPGHDACFYLELPR